MTLVGLQLWTVRNRLDDVERLFAEVAAVGVGAVEPFGLGRPDIDPGARIAHAARLRRAADSAGLAILSTHTALPEPTDASVFLDEMGALGVSAAVAAVPESLSGFGRDAFRDFDSVRRYAQKLNALAQTAAAAGLRIGYHNHAWEWNELEDGSLAYDRLWEELAPEVVAELDLLWATFAGQDAPAIIRRLGDRVRFLHAGDAAPVTNTDHQLPAGQGDAPLGEAFAVAGPRLEAVFIEATTPPPGSTELDLVAASATWLTARLAAGPVTG
ncbi:MAG: sugar phosphate isomerase/epimerase [Naasia sp.]|nr:sugar phosphate isomerase/epimerase [Naasia sp.]